MIINQRESITWGEVNGIFMYGSKVTYYEDKHISRSMISCIKSIS